MRVCVGRPSRHTDFNEVGARLDVLAYSLAKALRASGNADPTEFTHAVLPANPNPGGIHPRPWNLTRVDRVPDPKHSSRTGAEVDDGRESRAQIGERVRARRTADSEMHVGIDQTRDDCGVR